MKTLIDYNDLGQPVIQLTQNDYDNCVNVSELMQATSKQLNHKDGKWGITAQESWEAQFCGALGEQTIANYFDYDYSYLGYDANRSDVLGYQIRATYHGNGSLITHPIKTSTNPGGDNAGRYILVTIDKSYSATIRGYSSLTRCNKRTENWTTKINGCAVRWPAYFMPQTQLWPIEMLPATDELINHQQRRANGI